MLIPIVTERLLIRPPAPTDIEAMHRVFSDSEVMRYISDGSGCYSSRADHHLSVRDGASGPVSMR